jgi:nitronate monooxygenase
MTAVFDLRGLTAPIVQAGMGAVARHELAAAVSEAGGLGTIGGAGAPIADELAAARRLTGRPIAVNLVLPLLRPGDVRAAADADVIVTFGGSHAGLLRARGSISVAQSMRQQPRRRREPTR